MRHGTNPSRTAFVDGHRLGLRVALYDRVPAPDVLEGGTRAAAVAVLPGRDIQRVALSSLFTVSVAATLFESPLEKRQDSEHGQRQYGGTRGDDVESQACRHSDRRVDPDRRRG